MRTALRAARRQAHQPPYGPGALQPGDPTRLGGYKIARRIGAGGMGTVFLAYDRRRQPVAIKLLHAHLRDDPVFRRRFAGEVAAAARVAGYGTARVLDADPGGKVPYLVTEYVDGMSLHDRVTDGGPLTAAEAHGLAVGVAAALSAIHGAGVVHRDLKPRNVMLSTTGPKVIDFGIAGAIGPATPQPVSFGTPGWLAPEQLTGAPGGPAADVYAWGLLIAWAATGRHPLDHEPHDGVPDLSGVPAGLLPMARAAVVPDPAARPTARSLLAGLAPRGHDATYYRVGRSRVPAVQTRVVPSGSTGKRDKGPQSWSGAGITPSVRNPWPGAHSTRPAPMALVAGGPMPSAGGGPAFPVNPGRRRPAPSPAAPTRRARTVRNRRRRRALRRMVTAVLLAAGVAAGWQIAAQHGWPRAVAGAVRGTTAAGPADAPPAKTVSPGKPHSPPGTARDGGLQFALAGMHCGDTQLGDWPVTKHAKGQFCRLDLTVTNIGGHTGYVFVGSQRLVDDAGHEYPADQWAWVFLPGGRAFTRPVDRGTSATGTLVFDVPAGTHATRLVVHDSPVSDGAELSLS